MVQATKEQMTMNAAEGDFEDVLDTPEAEDKYAVVPAMTLQDFVTMTALIDLGTERGAWKGNEILEIGALRLRIEAFLAKNLSPETEAETTAEA